ncbi:MAG: excinuclease ABC subunit UvrA [Albidovulum sp.]|nr:excinuclease ABC subunit UvrA [Albidovulum sp.]
MAELKEIRVRGAREHNLKSVDVDIPRNKLVVVTGLSGSGKSSLALDTIYAEGQRRYVESLSAYARQFLNMMEKPDVDQIMGLSPAISIEQKSTSKNPRSTVGTVTEIYDYLRLLFARVGTPISPATGLPITAQQVSDMVRQIFTFEPGTRALLLAPIVRDRKGEYKNEMQELRKKGFQRIRVDGEVHDLDSPPVLDKKFRHNIELVVDRIVVDRGGGQRYADSLRTALDLASGIAFFETVPDEGDSERVVFSENFSCPESGFTIPEIEPRLFSFNAPFGACPDCDGLGREMFFDPERIVPDKSMPLFNAIAPWGVNSASPYLMSTLRSLEKHYKFSLYTPWCQQSPQIQNVILYGSNRESIQFRYSDSGREYKVERQFEGVIPNLQRRYRETSSDYMRQEFEKFMNFRPCEECDGFRLKPEALAVKIGGSHISEVTDLSISKALSWASEVPEHLSSQNNKIAETILKEIRERLQFLVNVGLEYLTLSRASGTLSGGESQRIRLASQIGSGLTGVLYVLDEPSIGLHQRDNRRLLDTLAGLRDQGNSVIVVEHDEETIREADFVLDMGPGAGTHGGEIVASGPPGAIAANPASITGQYLKGKLIIAVPENRRNGKGVSVNVIGACGNNLKKIDVEFPLGKFICVTGVSGSGKSTLTIETLYKIAHAEIHAARHSPAKCARIEGLSHIDKIIQIDQRPIGRTPRSNPATYTGAFAPIRDWYAELPDSKMLGYKPGRFSFNVRGGRCEACKGDGLIKIEMHFLPDVYVKCENCGGKRYNDETLEIKFKGKSIADILDMTVEDASRFFEAIPAIHGKLSALKRVGLGYIKVGQQATTLSGGEAQRVKLSKELSRKSTGRTMYILDEPTTGLHFDDVKKLLEVLHELVDQGNTVIVIEHNLDVVKTADWIIDVGPEGGDLGGNIVAAGTPEDIASSPESHTGRFLAACLVDRQAAA